MRDFTDLSEQERRAVRAVARHQKEQRTLKLQRHTAVAAIRLADAVSPTLGPDTREQALFLARLARRKTHAYESLARVNPALAYTSRKLNEAVSELSLMSP
jgi:hypothetical protein